MLVDFLGVVDYILVRLWFTVLCVCLCDIVCCYPPFGDNASSSVNQTARSVVAFFAVDDKYKNHPLEHPCSGLQSDAFMLKVINLQAWAFSLVC